MTPTLVRDVRVVYPKDPCIPKLMGSWLGALHFIGGNQHKSFCCVRVNDVLSPTDIIGRVVNLQSLMRIYSLMLKFDFQQLLWCVRGFILVLLAREPCQQVVFQPKKEVLVKGNPI